MTDNLKPCHRCGNVSEPFQTHDAKANWYFVECGNCGFTGPSFKWPSEAITAWNTRPEPQASQVKVKPLVWDRILARLENGCYYQIIQSRSGKTWCVSFVYRDGSHTLGYYKGEEAAKAAAQAHHEKLVLSQLETEQDAPKRIWAWPFSKHLQSGNWTEGSNDHCEMERAQEMGTELYHHNDIVSELVAALKDTQEALKQMKVACLYYDEYFEIETAREVMITLEDFNKLDEAINKSEAALAKFKETDQ